MSNAAFFFSLTVFKSCKFILRKLGCFSFCYLDLIIQWPIDNKGRTGTKEGKQEQGKASVRQTDRNEERQAVGHLGRQVESAYSHQASKPTSQPAS